MDLTAEALVLENKKKDDQILERILINILAEYNDGGDRTFIFDDISNNLVDELDSRGFVFLQPSNRLRSQGVKRVITW